MSITIDENECKKVGLTLPETLMLLIVKSGADIKNLIKSMLEKQILVESDTLLGKEIFITPRWNDNCDIAILKADKNVPKEDRLEALAKKLMSIFPEGRKSGTRGTGNYYWRGNIREIKLKLSLFFKLYGNRYSDEQIIDATQRYVNSFNGDYTYMRILKYFILKNDRKEDSEGNYHIEEVSNLAEYIEHADEELKQREDWMSTMI